MKWLRSHACGNSVDCARNLRGVNEKYNPFLLQHGREGYKRYADCTVGSGPW